MDCILHPVSGEEGYFCTKQEKILIDAILHDYSSQFVLNSSANGRGVNHE